MIDTFSRKFIITDWPCIYVCSRLACMLTHFHISYIATCLISSIVLQSTLPFDTIKAKMEKATFYERKTSIKLTMS